MKRALIISSLLFSFSSLSGQPITWTSPVTISSPNVNGSDPRVAMDPNGNLVAVWVENSAIIANTMPFGGSWGTAVTLSSATASSPKVKVDAGGNATALWIENGAATTAALPLNGTWTGKTTLSATGATDPHLAVDATGNVVASWTIASTIQSATKLVSSSWQATPDTVSDAGIASDSSQISIGSDGTVALIWHGVQNSVDKIFAVTKPVNGSWGVIQTLPSTNSATNPRIAVDSSGKSLALWYEFTVSNGRYSNVNVMSSDLPKNGVWQSPIKLNVNSGVTNPNLLQSAIGVDPNGSGVAVWNISFDGATFFIESAVRSANGLWTAAADLDATFYCNALNFEIDGSGNVILAHTTGNPSFVQVVALNLDADSYASNSWSNPYFISNPNSSFAYATGTSSLSSQNVAVIWEGFDGTYTNIQTALGSVPPMLPPSNLSAVQSQNNFGIVTEYFNTLTWTASQDPNLAGYVVFRNGVQAAILDPNTTQFVDHNRNPSQSDTYSVAAFGTGSEQSALITITFP